MHLTLLSPVLFTVGWTTLADAGDPYGHESPASCIRWVFGGHDDIFGLQKQILKQIGPTSQVMQMQKVFSSRRLHDP